MKRKFDLIETVAHFIGGAIIGGILGYAIWAYTYPNLGESVSWMQAILIGGAVVGGIFIAIPFSWRKL